MAICQCTGAIVSFASRRTGGVTTLSEVTSTSTPTTQVQCGGGQVLHHVERFSLDFVDFRHSTVKEAPDFTAV